MYSLKRLYIIIRYMIIWLYKNRLKVYISLALWFFLKNDLLVPLVVNIGNIIKHYLLNPDFMQWVIKGLGVLSPFVITTGYKLIKSIMKKDGSSGTQ